MKKYLTILILIMLVSLPGAASEKKADKQVGYNFVDAKINQIVDQSGSVITVNIKDNSFQPSDLIVPVGSIVEWHNQDGVQHIVTSDLQGIFDPGVLMPGKKFAFTFNTPGIYGYHCSIHPEMKGSITVTGIAGLQDSSSQGLRKAGSNGAGSNGAGSASWSETLLGSGEQVMSAGLQSDTKGAKKGSSLLQQSNPILDQTALQATGQASGQASGQTTGQASGQTTGQGSSQAGLQKFAQYYRSASEAPKDQLTAPTKVDLNDVEPDTLYFGSTQKAVPYVQYQAYALSTGANSIWIYGTSSWTQYAMVPLGSMLSMVTTSSAGGYGYLYEIYPDGSLDKNSYYFNPYSQIVFYADKVGEHQLFFNIAGQPSNVIIIEVVPYQIPAEPVYNLAAITVSSTWLSGYNVYVDGSLQATEGMMGYPDGSVTINVAGNQYHNIAIDGSGLTFTDYKYFKSGYAYQLNV